MKKFKALFLSLALCLTFATALTAVGCKGCGDDGEDSSSVETSDSSLDFGAEDSPVQLRFAQGQVSVNQYETIALGLTVKGTSKTVTYVSSDETVATVDENGVVTAKDKVASATITATVEGVSATCIVNVVQSPYAPEIVVGQRNYTIEDGDVLKFSVETEWNKSVISDDITYTATFAEESLNANASLAVSGNEITVTSAGVESFDVIVSATVRGIYTSKSVSVNVVEAQLKIQPTSSAFMPTAGGFTANVSTTDQIASGYANSCALDFVVGKGSQTFDNVEINWTVNDATKAKISDGSIVGQKRGTVEVTGTATHNGETASVKITCEVVPPEVHLEETAVFDVSEISQYVVTSELLGTLQNAELHGEVVTSSPRPGNRLMFNKELFPQKASLLGEQVLVVNTDLVRYTMDVEVYTKILRTADDLRNLKTIANTGETEICNATNVTSNYGKEVNSQFFDGYFILGNDIAFNDVIESFAHTGDVWGVQGSEKDYTRGFKGVFDGKGYTIDGVESCENKYSPTQSGGIFGYLTAEGVIRNVNFTNAVLRGLNGFICAYGDGLIENVVVSYKKIGGNVETPGLASADDYRAMATFFSRGAGVNATVKNCIVDASMAEIVYSTAVYKGLERCDLNLFGKATNVIDSYVLSADATVLQYAGNATKLSGFAELSTQGGAIFENYDETVWAFENGVPMLSNPTSTFDKNAPIAFVDTKDTLIADFTMPVRLDSPYVAITISEVAGVSYANGILTATEEAKGEQVTLTATSLLNPGVQATHVVTIDWLGEKVAVPTGEVKTVYHTNPVIEIGDNSWLGTENYAYVGDKLIASGATLKINLDEYGWNNWGEQNVTVVTVKEGNKTRFDVTLNIAYDENVMESAEVVMDTFLTGRDDVTWSLLHPGVALTDSEDKPEGFETITQFNAREDVLLASKKGEWKVADYVALGAANWIQTDVREYEELWFAIKGTQMRTNIIPGYKQMIQTEWVYFHLTNTGAKGWNIEVTVDGAILASEVGQVDNETGSSQPEGSLMAILQGAFASCTDGFAIRIDIMDPNAIFYTTEVLGVKKN